ncbi:MAG TPA: hypothetical protein VKA68_14020 [bacterium]|nr:hypothetical protein [bacterium]
MKLSLKIMLAVVAVIIVVQVLVFYLIGIRYEHLLNENLTDVARTMYKQVVLMRSWVSQHGGVYVSLRMDGTINPYLKEPLVTLSSGDTLLKKIPPG